MTRRPSRDDDEVLIGETCRPCWLDQHADCAASDDCGCWFGTCWSRIGPPGTTPGP